MPSPPCRARIIHRRRTDFGVTSSGRTPSQSGRHRRVARPDPADTSCWSTGGIYGDRATAVHCARRLRATLTTDFPIQAILDHLVVTIVEVLPIDAAGVTLIAPGSSPHFIAASDESALCFEELQTELWEGPCLAAYETGEAVAIADLAQDTTFPRFAERASAAGLVAVFTFPLRQETGRLGALDLYCTTPGCLTQEAMAAAQTLADVTTAYLMNAQARADLTQSSEVALENSLHDSLTGLPNRALLIQRLDHAIRRSRRSKKTVAILFADLDRFKVVNDTYGHRIGDELLIAVADRISRLLRPGDTLARLAGDEFIILCDDLEMPSQAELLANRVGTALARPFQLSDIEVQLSASVGIAFAGQGSDVPEQIIQDADTAMYQAKRKGGARFGTIDLGEQHLAIRRAGPDPRPAARPGPGRAVAQLPTDRGHRQWAGHRGRGPVALGPPDARGDRPRTSPSPSPNGQDSSWASGVG